MDKKKSPDSPVERSASAGFVAEPQPKLVRANVNREETASPSFVTLYTNDTQLQVSPWDVRLIFGEISRPPTDENPRTLIKQTGEVRMSPQHAKVVAKILMAQLKLYEENYGPIPLPPDRAK